MTGGDGGDQDSDADSGTDAGADRHPDRDTGTNADSDSTDAQDSSAGVGPGAGSRPSTNGHGQAGDTPTTVDGELATLRGVDGRTEDPESIDAYTTDRRSISSTVQLHWGLRVGIASLVLGVVAAGGLGAAGIGPQVAPAITAGVLVVGLVWVVLRYRAWVYQVRTDALYLERGVTTHVRTLVPYVRIQHVDTSRSPLERALGLSTLVVYTAGSRGADVSIPGLTPEEARDLQQRVKELAIEAEGTDAV